MVVSCMNDSTRPKRVVVVAREPQGFRNLRQADHAVGQIGTKTHPVAVRVLERAPFFAKYESKAARLIPVALLTPA
jgi:hypothetical protein